MSSLCSGSMTITEAASAGIKLRESCDACLQAKVKCSKGRPVCTRCLSNGSHCQYSPSARAGRKNRNSKSGVKKLVSDTASQNSTASTRIGNNTSVSSSSTISQWPSQSPAQSQAHHTAGGNDARTNVCPAGPTGASHCCGTTTPPLTNEEEALGMTTQQSGDTRKQDQDDEFPYKFLHTPPFSSLEVVEDSRLDVPFSASMDISFGEYDPSPPPQYTDQAFNPDPWIGQDPTYNSTQPLNHISHEPSFVDTLPPWGPPPNHVTHGHNGGQTQLQPADPLASECDCFVDCLQSLTHLHNEQSGSQLDVVLQINSAAVNASNKMLACMPCSNNVGVGVTTMLIATLIGKALSLYRAAVLHRFGPTDGSRTLQSDGQLAFGAYRVNGEDILLLQQLTADKDATCMNEALAMYLEKNLHYVAEYLRSRIGVGK